MRLLTDDCVHKFVVCTELKSEDLLHLYSNLKILEGWINNDEKIQMITMAYGYYGVSSDFSHFFDMKKKKGWLHTDITVLSDNTTSPTLSVSVSQHFTS